MTVLTRLNQYNGINPHLNDRLQSHGMEWKEFHDTHIVHMRDMMNEQLIAQGYEARLVSGLQLSSFDPNIMDFNNPHKIQPDVVIKPYKDVSAPQGRGKEYDPDAGKNMAEFPIPEALNMNEEEYLNALAVVRIGAPKDDLPVAWIELLSPSNKPGGAHHDKYEDKRFGLLDKGIPLVEIDYLNQTRPNIPIILPYPEHPEAMPYNISVIDPRPTQDFPEGSIKIHDFGVEDSIPSVVIPFRDSSRGLEFEFDRAYDHTLQTSYYWTIDYEQPPMNLDKYSDRDQNIVAARMYTVLEAARDGRVELDLTKPPTPAQPLSLSCNIDEGPSKLASLDEPDNDIQNPNISLDL